MKGSWFNLLGVIALFVAAVCGGCQLPGPPQRSSALIEQPRSGEVFLVRGLFGIFSTGMDKLQETLSERGIRAIALQHTDGASASDWIIKHYNPSNGPIILVGHSLGANEAVAMATTLNRAHVPVDLMITLDPVASLSVPGNVRRAVNYYRPAGVFGPLPVLRGMALDRSQTSKGMLYNIDLNDNTELDKMGGNHFTIDKSSAIQKLVVNQIVSICPLEPQAPRAIRATITSISDGR